MTPPIAPPTAGPNWDAPSLIPSSEPNLDDASVVSIDEVTAGPVSVFSVVNEELGMSTEENVSMSVLGRPGMVLIVGVVDMS